MHIMGSIRRKLLLILALGVIDMLTNSAHLSDLTRCGTSNAWKEFGDSCYFACVETSCYVAFQKAEEMCLSNEESHLASIHSIDEQRFIRGIADNALVWIGLQRSWTVFEKRNNFSWIDETTVHFVNWERPSPFACDDTHTLGCDRGCVHMVPSGGWIHSTCNNPAVEGFICKRKALPSPPTELPSKTNNSSSPDSKAGLIAGTISGVIVLILCIVIIFLWMQKRINSKTKNSIERKIDDEEPGYMIPNKVPTYENAPKSSVSNYSNIPEPGDGNDTYRYAMVDGNHNVATSTTTKKHGDEHEYSEVCDSVGDHCQVAPRDQAGHEYSDVAVDFIDGDRTKVMSESEQEGWEVNKIYVAGDP